MASALWLPVIFCTALVYLYLLASYRPSLEQDELIDAGASAINASEALGFPSNLEELNVLASLLSVYANGHLPYVLLLFCSAYLFKQTFAIPGSVFMNLLAGALFGISYGFPLVCVLTGVGATNCFLLSRHFGKRHVMRFFGAKIAPLQRKVEENRDGVFLLLLSLRLFPMAPNWLMNMAAPILNIPVRLFFPSVLIGLMPYNFLCVEAGCILSDITSTADILTVPVMLKMLAAAALTLLPSYVVKCVKRRQHAD